MGSAVKRPWKRLAATFLLIAATQAVLVVVATRTYFAQDHTLLTNGGWIATKTTLDRGLVGAFAFITERQALAYGALNLGAWHGFQEVIHRRTAGPLRSLEFDFHLDEHGYVAALFNRDPEGGYSGVRLRAFEREGAPLAVPGPSLFFTATADGEFTQRQLLSIRGFKPQEWHRARLELTPSKVALSVDGEAAGIFPVEARERQQFGFRSGARPVFVTDVVATLKDGTTITENFDPPQATRGWLLTGIVALIVASFALSVVLRWTTGVDVRRLGFAFLTFSLTLLSVAAILSQIVRARGGWYPRLNAALVEREAYFRNGAKERVLAEIRQRYRAGAEGDPYRILFVGSSQTWGAGARHHDGTLVAVVESLLNRDAGAGRRYECINAGISSARARDLRHLLVEEWLPLRPRFTLINLSSNDKTSETEEFVPHIEAMVRAIRAAGGAPVLIKEANMPLLVESGLRVRHRDLDRIAAEHRVPIIDMGSHLFDRREEGFLWWDNVHLTSFGQRLAAERIVEELRRLGVADGDG